MRKLGCASNLKFILVIALVFFGFQPMGHAWLRGHAARSKSVISNPTTPPSYISSSNTVNAQYASSISVGKPAGTTTNDIICLLLNLETTSIPTPPTGFSLLAFADQTNSPFRLFLFWKRSDGSEPGTLTFTYSGNLWGSVAAVTMRGARTSGNPFNTFTQAASVGTSSTTPPLSLTVPYNNSLLIWAVGVDDDGSTPWTQPAGYTKRQDTYALALATKTQGTAGTTGSTTGDHGGYTSGTSYSAVILTSLTGI